MKIYNLTRLSLLSLTVIACFNSCSKDDGDKSNASLTEDSGIIPPTFSDSWGYLDAYKISFPINTDVNEEEIEYSMGSLVADAYFLPSAGSSKFDADGGGDVYLNNSILANIMGAYIGSSVDASKAIWQVSGNSKVTAFIDSCNTFVPLTGLTIPSWSSCNVNEDLIITIHGSTSDASVIYVECESKPGLSYDDDKFLTKTIQPGSTSCTITSDELKKLKSYYSLGFTLTVEAFTSKKTTSGNKNYYMNNGSALTHAVYFTQDQN